MRNNNDYLRVREKLKSYMLNARDIARKTAIKGGEDFSKKAIFTQCRTGFLNDKFIKRLVIFMRGTGCSLAKDTGGCTFCGIYNATNFGEKFLDSDYIQQIKSIVNDNGIKFSDYSVICLYNDGCLLSENEISFQGLIQIISLLDKIDTIKKIVIESRIESLAEEKLKAIRDATDKEFEIAVGFESANPMIRDLCINKSFSNIVFEEKLKIAERYSINIVPLLMLKPPFLAELEAIEDFVNSLKYLELFNLKRVDMELPTIQRNTLMYDLWLRGMYTPAKLWSVIEILRRKKKLNLRTPVYISPMDYSVSHVARATNCDLCDGVFIKQFEEYNRDNEISLLRANCACYGEWRRLITSEKSFSSGLALQKRISKDLDTLMTRNTKMEVVVKKKSSALNVDGILRYLMNWSKCNSV